MSNLPPGGQYPGEPFPEEPYPDWQGGDTGNVPLSPEPEPTYAGGTGGSGGWGEEPRNEPFAVAAMVWAVVSIVIPVIGTIVAFVLAQRAADSIRRSNGTRKGEGLVNAARITAGAVLAFWAIGLISFFALRGGDSSNNNDVAVPTNPPVSTTLAPVTTSTTKPLTTTTTKPPVTTTTAPPPTVTVVPPPPTTAPVTTAAPPTTAAPTTAPPTTAPPTTAPPTTAAPPTTIPDSQKSEILAQKMLAKNQLGPSNRGVPDDERFVVDYQAGQPITVTWAINNGAEPLPIGEATCTVPPPTTTTSTTVPGETTTTTTTTTTLPAESTTTTTLPAGQKTTSDLSRYEARQILLTIKGQINSLKLNFTDVQLIGTYPITGTGGGEDAVVEVLYPHSAVQSVFTNYKKAFEVPPATVVQCLNPEFVNP